MLSPDARTVALDLLRAPPGYGLDLAVLTSYTLDLETLLALPLGVLAQSDQGLEQLLEDPLLLLEALREAGDRVHVFVDEAGVAPPGKQREIYAMLESSIHPVRAPHGGAFHPKVWLARFTRKGAEPRLRVAVLSRNLTFDRSWDIALSSEAIPTSEKPCEQSRPLCSLLRALPALCESVRHPLDSDLTGSVLGLAEQVEACSFPSPADFEGPIGFHALGLDPSATSPWCPRSDGSRLLAIAPFVNASGLQALQQMSRKPWMLVSRQEELDKLPADTLASWDPVRVLADAAHDEPEDEGAPPPSGLHAKLIAIEHGCDVSWYVGSANLTRAALHGSNVELVASVTGKKGRKGGQSGQGIERFLEAGFANLLDPYTPIEAAETTPEVVDAQRRLSEAQHALLQSELSASCTPRGEDWEWCIEGQVAIPAGVQIKTWPISIPEEQAHALAGPLLWTLPTTRLTAFAGFCLSVDMPEVEDARLVLKLPVKGMPEGRMRHVLRTLISSPERFLRFLRALLGGLEGLPDDIEHGGDGDRNGDWDSGFEAETLLEDLVRAASRDPERLTPIRNLIADLHGSEEGAKIVPDDLLQIWNAVEEALGSGEAP